MFIAKTHEQKTYNSNKIFQNKIESQSRELKRKYLRA